MIGAYGQDDRVCAYTALMAEIETENPDVYKRQLLAAFTMLNNKKKEENK